MAGYVNKVILCGRLGRDPETRTLSNGSKTTSFSMATSESWMDKASGERKEKTQWHQVVIWNENLGSIAERYLKKGSSVLIEGAIESRKYTTKEGVEREITEIVLSRFKGDLVLMGDKSDGGGQRGEPVERGPAARSAAPAGGGHALDDDIPFGPCWQ